MPIVITGASRGIGEAAARLFAEAGAKVALLARGRDEIARIAAGKSRKLRRLVFQLGDDPLCDLLAPGLAPT